MPSLLRRKRSKKRKFLERKPHIARCLIPDAAFIAVPCSPTPSSPQGRRPLWRPASAPVVSVATQAEFSPRNLPKDQSLLSYDSDGSVATDPGYSTVRRSSRVVEEAEVVVETSPKLLKVRARYPSPKFTNSGQSSPRHNSSTLPSISSSPCSGSEVDEAMVTSPPRVMGSSDAATAFPHHTSPSPVYAKVNKQKRGSPCLRNDQGTSKRKSQGDKHAQQSSRNVGEDVDVNDEFGEFSEISYDSDELTKEMQASEEEAGHVASSSLASHCRPPSGPHVQRGVAHSPTTARRRRPLSTGSPLFLPSMAGLPVYNLQQQPQASGDQSYLLSRASPDGNIEYFTATPITTPVPLNSQFLPSPVLPPQGGMALPVTLNNLPPSQMSFSTDKTVPSRTAARSPEVPANKFDMTERLASELEGLKVERNKLKAEVVSLKQQYQSVKESADIKALEQAYKVQLTKQENSALHETMGKINTMISSCPLASANQEDDSSGKLEQVSFNKEPFQVIPEKLQTVLKSHQIEVDRLKAKCSRLISRQEATRQETTHLQKIEAVEKKTLEQRLLSTNEENFRLQEQLKLERARFATTRKEHKELVGKLGSALIKLRKERHGIQMELFALNHSHSQLEEKLTHAHSLGHLSLEEHRKRIRRFERQLEESAWKNNSNQCVLKNHMSDLQQKNYSLSIQLSECQGKLAVATAQCQAWERDVRTYQSRVASLHRELMVSQEREATTADQLSEAVVELERAIAERDVLAELSHSHTSDQFMPMSASSVRRKLALEDFKRKLDSFKQEQLLQRQRVELLLQKHLRKHQNGVTGSKRDQTTETLHALPYSHKRELDDMRKTKERQEDELEWFWKTSTDKPQFTSTPKPTRTDQ